jgi:hypothetical protein
MNGFGYFGATPAPPSGPPEGGGRPTGVCAPGQKRNAQGKCETDCGPGRIWGGSRQVGCIKDPSIEEPVQPLNLPGATPAPPVPDKEPPESKNTTLLLLILGVIGLVWWGSRRG